MNTLDIIKYISFRPKHSKVLSVVSMPVAYKSLIEYKTYCFFIGDKKYLPFLLREYSGRICNIRTVFGDDYKGYWSWFNREDKKILVVSEKKMRYENNYIRSIHCSKRFSLMEIGNVY